MSTTLLTPVELRSVLDCLDTRIESLAMDLAARLEEGETRRPHINELRDRLIVLRRAREKIIGGGL